MEVDIPTGSLLTNGTHSNGTVDTSLTHITELSKTCKQLTELGVRLLEQRKIVQEKPEDPAEKEKLNAFYEDASALFVSLKELNRRAYTHTRQIKASTTDSKQELDRLNLDLQNLRYERQHLQQEISKCKAFDSIYQDLELVPESEFLEKASGELTEPKDSHLRMLNRLKFEQLERIRLDAEKKELMALKLKLIKLNKEKKLALEKIDLQLDTFAKSSAPLQVSLGLPTSSLNNS
ncbi:hypothetical protein K493DRAFT_319626 [Basidiobolus meristosporus CBS 931.73]|uniref:Uncharacterized protein n=1 Tax=Basidiobolus meristosporus CBS 931.73 TaxID=1314790 RepID=A0A1Y1XPR9_9FUNG|nr:hypothetical protein K493DRAFT_319626 [Basidiobolus meristosporus CBS 931.73]|eukprot:ORX87737.1 hypothetical protein K493DRAFT_319626 [Basidiobolus meristosporus CBS 931.73]